MDREMLGPVVTTDQWPDLVAVPPYYLAAQTIMSDRPEREMLGPVVKTEWPELVDQPYFTAAQTIVNERPDVQIQIVELAPAEDLPYGWPSDYTRVCVKVDASTMTVYGGDPNYPCPQCG